MDKKITTFLGKEVVMGDHDKTDAFPKQVNRILEAVEKVAGISGAFVTDGSLFSDFMMDEEEEKQAYEFLGIPPQKSEYFGDIAQRLYNAENKVN